MSRAIAIAVLIHLVGLSWADRYTVLNHSNSGLGSLRHAINQANAHPGADTIVFAPSMAEDTIAPVNGFDSLWDPQTTVNGDIDGDGAPDVTLSGARLSAGGPGLWVSADQCVIKGLAFIRFRDEGVWLGPYPNANSCAVESCYFGINLNGLLAPPNPLGDFRYGDILLSGGDGNTIGGTVARRRNVFAATHGGVVIQGSEGNLVLGNYFGLAPDGVTSLETGGVGVMIRDKARYNTIGGETAGARNLFGGLDVGVEVLSRQNVVQGNYLGLAADGDTIAPISFAGVALSGPATGNTIGGTSLGARNVFAGAASYGVDIETNCAGNDVQGNLFGSNAAGTAQRDLGTGVYLGSGARANTIGGSTASARNYFTPAADGVLLGKGGSGSVITYNRFGVRLDGADAPIQRGLNVYDATVTVTDNLFANGSSAGIQARGSATVNVFRNAFRNTSIAVSAADTARCRLGDLRNASMEDDGGNRFRSIGSLFVSNQTANGIRAEGNDFGTTSQAAIDAKITDRLDNPAYGRVDFIPLKGGVTPTGQAEGILAVTSAAAQPTTGGAEVSFTLSAPAEVTVEVLNIAGRPVALLARERPTDAGVQRLTWNGRSLTGTAAPTGRYVARITARDASGAQATAVAPLQLGR